MKIDNHIIRICIATELYFDFFRGIICLSQTTDFGRNCMN
jgi:hypothetical protein